MRRYIFLFLYITFSFALETVAIIDFEGIGITESEARALTQRLTSEIVEIGKFTVVERSEMKRLLDEQKFQYSGCVDVSCAVEIGKLLGAKSMVVGTISKLGNSYSVDSRLIDVKTAENYVSANYTTTKDLGDVLNGMRNIAYKICEMENPDHLITKEKQYSSTNSKIKTISEPPGAEARLTHEERDTLYEKRVKLMLGEEKQISIQLKKVYDIVTIKKIFFRSKIDTIHNIINPKISKFGHFIEYIDKSGFQSKVPCSIVSELIGVDGESDDESYNVDCISGNISNMQNGAIGEK